MGKCTNCSEQRRTRLHVACVFTQSDRCLHCTQRTHISLLEASANIIRADSDATESMGRLIGTYIV